MIPQNDQQQREKVGTANSNLIHQSHLEESRRVIQLIMSLAVLSSIIELQIFLLSPEIRI